MHSINRLLFFSFFGGLACFCAPYAFASISPVSFTVNFSETVVVTGCPSNCPYITLDVGGQTRQAYYASGSGTSALTFTYTPVVGDVDLDGISISSNAVNLNTSGTLKDTAGNNATLTFTVPSTSGIKINYPSLSMDFVYDSDGRYTLNGTSYDTLPALLTAGGGAFSRNTTATYYDSSGIVQTAAANVPRFDWDPTTHAAKGLLLEDARTNLSTYSEQYDNGAWIKDDGSVVANATTAPDGTMTADMYVANTNNAQHRIKKGSYAVAAGQMATISTFVKYGGYNLQLWFWSAGGNALVAVNLTTGAVITTGGAEYVSNSVVALPNGWYRVSVTLLSAAGGSYQPLHYLYNGTPSFTGDGVSGVYLWGSQVEIGGFPTSYIKTVASTVTRPVDTLTLPVGTWYNQSAGAFVDQFKWQSSSGSSFPMFFRVDDGTGNNRWDINYSMPANTLIVDAFYGGTGESIASISSSTSGSARISSAQTTNSANAAFNGTLKTLKTTWTTPTVTQLNLGGSGANKWHSYVAYYPLRVADAQLTLLSQ